VESLKKIVSDLVEKYIENDLETEIKIEKYKDGIWKVRVEEIL